MRDDCPCKDCTERKAACHDVCEPYKQWIAKRHAENEKRREDEEFYIYLRKKTDRLRKRKHLRKKGRVRE